MKKQLKSLLLITLLVGMTASAWAQSSTEGKEFWVAATIMCQPPTASKVAVPYIAVSAQKACTVKIFDYQGTLLSQATVADGSWTEFGNTNNSNTGAGADPDKGPINYYLDPTKWYPTQNVVSAGDVYKHADKINNFGLYITATANISVFAILRAVNSMDASNILPITALKSEYYTQDYWPNAHDISNNVTMTTILAIKDNTIIDITPNGNTYGKRNSGSTYQVTLNKGQTYYMMSENGEQLTGTHIMARDDKPIAVFNGCALTRIPVGISARDGLYEQSMPVDYWGTQFIVTRSKDKDGNIVGVTATENDTWIKIDGIVRTTIQAGETFYFMLQSHFNPNSKKPGDKPIPTDDVFTADVVYLETKCPCAVYSYDTGNSFVYSDSENENQGSGKNRLGDPTSVWISPIQQKIQQITFGACYTDMTKMHYVNVVTETATRDSTKLSAYYKEYTLDKTSLLEWNEVPGNKKYSYARVLLTDNNPDMRVFTLKNRHGFIGHIYGNGDDEAYAYSVGSSAVEQGVSVNGETFVNGYISDSKFCFGDEVDFDAAIGTDVILRVDWNFGDGITEYNGLPKTSHKYTTPGWFDVTADLYGHQACADENEQFLGSVQFSFRIMRQDTTWVYEHDCKPVDYTGDLDDEITYDDSDCSNIIATVHSFGQDSKRDELITREDIFVDEYTGDKYTADAEYDVNLTDLFGTKNHTDCDSIIHRTVKILTCIDLEIPNDSANQHACQGEQLYIPFTQSKGKRDYSYAEMNNQRIDIRFDDDDNNVILPVEDLKPGRYKATIYVYDAFCDNLHDYPIDFAVFYPKDIFIYKFGNVMAVLNQANNGGYDFRGYQWYLNGELVEGANSAVYQVDGSFAKGDLVYVNLLDKDGMWLPSCPQEVTEVPDFTPEANNAPAQKLLLNDQMVIRKDDRIFNIFGQRVK